MLQLLDSLIMKFLTWIGFFFFDGLSFCQGSEKKSIMQIKEIPFDHQNRKLLKSLVSEPQTEFIHLFHPS